MAKTLTIGIDPGLVTGWAINDDGRIEAGSWDLKAVKGADPLYTLYQRLTAILQYDPVGLVCYEEPVARGMAARSLNRQLGVIIVVCELHCVPHYPVNPGTLKKYATGKGNATKPEMATALPGNLQSDDHNAVDAIHLSEYGRTVVAPTMADE